MASWPLEQVGSSGEDVRSVQYLLDADGGTLTVDGDFGPLTQAAVEQFQTAHGLTADGIVGDETWPQLIIEVSSGATGDAVKAVQSQINSRPAAPLAVDGIFGPDTDFAVRTFQGDLGLNVDGIVGPLTWNPLVNGYLTSANPAEAMFDAWTHNDQATAAKNAAPSAVSTLFSRTWSAADDWTYSKTGVATGDIGVTWTGKPGTLIILFSDGAGAPLQCVNEVLWQ